MTPNIKHTPIKHFAFGLLLLAFGFNSCKKVDTFYEKLQALPQVDNTTTYVYKPAYIIGDTMVITGNLQPRNNLQITIGGKPAAIVNIDSLTDTWGTRLDKVSLLITEGMEGKAREVKITTGGYSTLGAAVDIYTPGGPGSFDKDLQSVLIKSFTNGGQNIFLHCQNGKGDVYYYSAANKDLRHIAKDGTETVLYDLSGTFNPGGPVMTDFLAGGIDPQGKQLYFSARTSPSDYAFCKIDLVSKQLTVLNQSQNIAAPYEGAVGLVKMVISGIYPDSNGKVYLALGFNAKEGGNLPNAIAQYSTDDGRVSYIYKKIAGSVLPGMPGSNIDVANGSIMGLRYSPDEKLLYVLERSFRDQVSAIIEVFDIGARVKLNNLAPLNPTHGLSQQLSVIAPFSGLQIDMGSGERPDYCFGYLPMPGRRLQILLSQVFNLAGNPTPALTAKYGFPKWVVFDFTEQRTYAYATGLFKQNGYIFQPSKYLFPISAVRDELLNYDEEGNLYATANGKVALIKTQTVN